MDTTHSSLKDHLVQILSPGALCFLSQLHDKFEKRRQQLLDARETRQAALDAGNLYTQNPDTAYIRNLEWQVAPPPPALLDRRVEITGPVDRKMMINALNSGAKVFMADFEDSCSPTWQNMICGQVNLYDAVRRQIAFVDEKKGKSYALKEDIATLVVRPRGWHLVERNLRLTETPISASLFDFGLYVFHNAKQLIENGSGPYFYLPKLESHLEARLWADVFRFAEDRLGIPNGTIKATVLIETIAAAHEMEEILYELRDHSCALNAGRWDYIFSIIKKMRGHSEFVLPDRAQITMQTNFMHAYTELMIKTCHKRGAQAIGGMAAFIPNRREPDITKAAVAKVVADKTREAEAGADGTWVAHPDLVQPVMAVFDGILGDQPNQLGKQRDDVPSDLAPLLEIDIPEGRITEQGVQTNIEVSLHYISAWLNGQGAVGINNLMEDVATAEISRVQLWQWLQHDVELDTGSVFDRALYIQYRDTAIEKLSDLPRVQTAGQLLDELTLGSTFQEFLTIPAQHYL